jgi:hypothetical protein
MVGLPMYTEPGLYKEGCIILIATQLSSIINKACMITVVVYVSLRHTLVEKIYQCGE